MMGAMSDADLTDDELDQLLLGAERYLAVRDHQAAYDLLADRHEAGAFQGPRLGRAALYLGEGCAGLDAWDAAHYYFDEARRHGAPDVAEQAGNRLAEIGRLDDAIDATADGVAGEDEAAATLAAADDALARGDHDGAWRYYSYAYDGLRLTDTQVARAAVGMAWCHINADELDTAAGYLDVAADRDDGTSRTGIEEARAQIAALAAGEQALADGVDRADLNELHRAAVAAASSGDFDAAHAYFEQMYTTDQIAGTERGRVAYNIGMVCLWRHDYDAAATYLDEARSSATSRIGDRASEVLRELQDLDRAEELATRTRTEEPLAEPGE
jgi:hypothetical protein